jgi:chemotaxis protein histidine kinase CheA
VLLDMSMIPLSYLEDRLNHVVRSQSRRLSKQVTFKMEGGDLQLDGRIAESLFEPLLHLINNALDHGIEDTSGERVNAGKAPSGHLLIRGRIKGDGVAIDVIDDGRGIDPEKVAAVAVSREIVTAAEAARMSDRERLALIWRPNVSTARAVTTLSGRGMGMKSVLDEITALQGRIEISSHVGQGTTFTIMLPRSLAMMRVEVVREGRDLVAVPITQVISTHPLAYRDPARFQAGETVEIQGRRLTIFGAHLAEGPVGDGEAGQSIVLEVAGRGGGLVVDEVMGSQYLPVRAAPSYLRRHCGVLGYAVGGGGRILPILDLPTLIERAEAAPPSAAPDQAEQPAYVILVVDDSQTMRRALRGTLIKTGFRVREAADGREALSICAAEMPDLITLDMEMPGMDGLEALSALRLLPNGGATVPVFMITSRQQARHRAAALAAGVTRYFTKPYDQDELVAATRFILSRGGVTAGEEAS